LISLSPFIPVKNTQKTMPDVTKTKNGPKRARLPASDKRYPRKRGLTACHVCRARKTKCDNVQPTCGFCASLGIHCSYDNAEKDHSQCVVSYLICSRGHINASCIDSIQLVWKSFGTWARSSVPKMNSHTQFVQSLHPNIM
jgi:hypothetical protein